MANDRSREQEILRAALGAGEECPPLEEVEQLLAGHISASTALGRHVQSCSYCQTEIQMLQAFYRGDEGSTSEEVRQVVSRLQANAKKVFPKSAAVKASVPWWQHA